MDGLRAVAVLAVVVFHAFPQLLPGGFVGVDVFFVISGFLISTIILKGTADGTFSYRDFYGRRLRRIGPALAVVLLAAMIGGWFILGWRDYQNLGRHALGGAGFVSNFLLWREAGYFDASAETKPLLHLWSLAIEEQFYIVWPLLLGIAWRRRWAPGRLIAGLAAASFVANVLVAYTFSDAAFYSPLTRFWELLVGAGLAWWTIRRPNDLATASSARAGIGAALLLAALILIDRSKAFPGWWALLPVAGTALLISAGPAAWVNARVLSNPVAVWIGKISYPLYLWHWPILSMALIANSLQPLPPAWRVAIVASSIALAWLTYMLVERPIRFSGRLATGTLASAGCLVAAMAATVYLLSGFPARQINGDAAMAYIKRYDDFKRGLGAFYPFECDFYAEDSAGGKAALAPACTDPKGGPDLVLLWGDSHAQALSWGIRQVLPPSARLAQITTSGCRPTSLDDASNGGPAKLACAKSTALARKFIEEHRPKKVIAAQREEHEKADWLALTHFVAENGGELLVMGPVPQWYPALPVIIANYKGPPRDYVAEGLMATVVASDQAMKTKYRSSPVRYVSIMDAMCSADGCRSTIDTPDPINLTVMDYGHLTPAASVFVANTVLRPFLQQQAP
nr:acyltransferase family protein [Variovorax sp. KBW07]